MVLKFSVNFALNIQIEHSYTLLNCILITKLMFLSHKSVCPMTSDTLLSLCPAAYPRSPPY